MFNEKIYVENLIIDKMMDTSTLVDIKEDLNKAAKIMSGEISNFLKKQAENAKVDSERIKKFVSIAILDMSVHFA